MRRFPGRRYGALQIIHRGPLAIANYQLPIANQPGVVQRPQHRWSVRSGMPIIPCWPGRANFVLILPIVVSGKAWMSAEKLAAHIAREQCLWKVTIPNIREFILPTSDVAEWAVKSVSHFEVGANW